MNLIKFLIKKLPSITITVNGKPYLTRYYLFLKDRKFCNVYIHHFHSSDQGEELHSHPWAWGLSFIVAGGYVEERSENQPLWGVTNLGLTIPAIIKKRTINPFTFNIVKSTDFHRVDLNDESKGAWSIFITGKRTKDWGFLNRHTGEFTHYTNNPEAIP